MIDVLYEFGQLQYSCGRYGGAADMLYHFRILVRTRSHLPPYGPSMPCGLTPHFSFFLI